METYEIMEYNRETQKYFLIGTIEAESLHTAKDKYIEVFRWKPKPNVLLFAKPPVCR